MSTFSPVLPSGREVILEGQSEELRSTQTLKDRIPPTSQERVPSPVRKRVRGGTKEGRSTLGDFMP